MTRAGQVPLFHRVYTGNITDIREVAVIYAQGTLAHRKDHMTFSRMTSRQKKLAEAFDIAQVLGG